MIPGSIILGNYTNDIEHIESIRAVFFIHPSLSASSSNFRFFFFFTFLSSVESVLTVFAGVCKWNYLKTLVRRILIHSDPLIPIQIQSPLLPSSHSTMIFFKKTPWMLLTLSPWTPLKPFSQDIFLIRETITWNQCRPGQCQCFRWHKLKFACDHLK